MRKLALSSEAGREYFEGLCRDVRRVVLKPLRDGNAVEYPAALVGRLDGASLLIDWPSDRDGLTPLRVGERIEVKFFSERDLVIFQVDLTLCCFRPRPYLHLAWPKEIACVEVRQVARIPMEKPAVFVRPAVDGAVAEQVRGRVVDLSMGGAAFICAQGDLPVGEQGELLLSINPEAGRTAVYVRPKAALRSRRDVPAGKGEFQYGVQFLEPSINDRLVLLAIVGEAALSRQD
jgi:c-di-GMP-binding flagellar brake protein YcgR